MWSEYSCHELGAVTEYKHALGQLEAYVKKATAAEAAPSLREMREYL